jgi:hypothetical protein
MLVAFAVCMTRSDVAHRLFEFLDEHAFAPVLAANPERFPKARRMELRAAQVETRRERARFERGASAEEIYRTYHEELAAPGAADLKRRLRALDLPTLDDLRVDFEQMAGDLGVGTFGSL